MYAILVIYSTHVAMYATHVIYSTHVAMYANHVTVVIYYGIPVAKCAIHVAICLFFQADSTAQVPAQPTGQ